MTPPGTMTLAARLRVPGYILLVAMSVLPLLDMLLMSWPVNVGQVAWRFASFGQLSASGASPLIALFLLYGLAYANGDRSVLYLGIALSVVYALILVGALVSFPFDAI